MNAYGQEVRTKLLDRCETFDLFDQVVKSGTEVYSATRHLPKSISDRRIALQLLGPIKIDTRAALKFADGDIMYEALQLKSQR